MTTNLLQEPISFSTAGNKEASSSSLQKLGQSWVSLSLVAAVFFSIVNVGVTEISNKGDANDCLFYFTSGGIACGIVNHLRSSWISYRAGGSFWDDQNIVVRGKLSYMNLFRYTLYSMVYLLVQYIAMATLWLAVLADINTGIITGIWNLLPLFMAILDYLFFGEVLTWTSIVGVVSLVICALCITFSEEEPEVLGAGGPIRKVDAWIPVLFGVLAPISFAVHGLMAKHYSNDKIKFDPNTMTFSSMGVANVGVLLVGIFWYWQRVKPFDWYLFTVGFAASILDCVGIVANQCAMTVGPAGPLSALVSLNTVFLVILEAVIQMRWPRTWEIIGFVIGFIGATFLVVPDQMERAFAKVFCRKRASSKE